MNKSKPLTWDDIAKIGVDLQAIKDSQVEGYFSVFKMADYHRGDKVLVNSEFFKDANISELVKHRILHNEYIPYGDYAVIRGDKEKPVFSMKFNYGLRLNSSALVCADIT